MSDLQRQLQHMAMARRMEIIPHVYHSTQGSVHTGPFAGMKIVPKVSWGDGDIAAKLLGVYEDELHKFIDLAVKQKPDLVINIGCAEGYYALGLAQCLPDSRVIAVDIEATSTEICRENQQANNLNNVTVITHEVDTEWLQRTLESAVNPLIFMDCEGAEMTLLDFDRVPALSKTSVIVECHDCITAGITETLTQRFQSTHEIASVDQCYKDPYKFDFLRQFSDSDKWALVMEGRPSTMTWLYTKPKA